MTENDDITLYNIALVKSYAYIDEYNTATGRVEERNGARFLKEGYVDGFLAGFAHKMGGGHGSD
jgi:RimJ/RimL family protein N-acetyltransferase